MKKNAKIRKPLTLNKLTVATLRPGKLAQVAGGCRDSAGGSGGNTTG